MSNLVILPVNVNAIQPPENAMRSGFDDAAFNDLCASIQELGLIQPITVVKRGEKYEIVAGHRRFEACKAIGLESIPCLVTSAGKTNIESIKLHENMMREDVSPTDEAAYLKRAMDTLELTPKKIAQLIHRSENYVINRLTTLDFHPALFDALDTGKLGLTVALELHRLPHERILIEYVGHAAANGISQKTAKQWVDDILRMDSGEPENAEVLGEQNAPVYVPEAQVCCAICSGNFKFTDTKLVRLCQPCAREANL